jgi:antirestriction protein
MMKTDAQDWIWNSPVNPFEDTIDSRQVIERIEELTRDWESGELSDDSAAELAALQELAEEASGYAYDWQYGTPLIRDSYFVEYAQELAEEIGAIDEDAKWPQRHIDWEAAARELQQDYAGVEFAGVTYWVR